LVLSKLDGKDHPQLPRGPHRLIRPQPTTAKKLRSDCDLDFGPIFLRGTSPDLSEAPAHCVARE
jgi:hypothetical protein